MQPAGQELIGLSDPNRSRGGNTDTHTQPDTHSLSHNDTHGYVYTHSNHHSKPNTFSYAQRDPYCLSNANPLAFTVFLHAGLFAEGETAHVDGRNYAKTWLWIQQANTGAHCWVAASAVDILGDLESVPVVPTDPPANPQVPSPQNVNAVRSNNKVTITWNPAPPALDLHYLVKAKVCNGQFIIEVLDTTLNTAYTLQDQQTCSGTSSAKIFTVKKLGYSQPVKVPWP